MLGLWRLKNDGFQFRIFVVVIIDKNRFKMAILSFLYTAPTAQVLQPKFPFFKT